MLLHQIVPETIMSCNVSIAHKQSNAKRAFWELSMSAINLAGPPGADHRNGTILGQPGEFLVELPRQNLPR